jgi:tetratricopeptide (TPR) repeat protein
LAEVARLRHNAAETEKWLQRAVEVAPESADVLRAWGRHQFTQRNFTLSEIALKKAAALDPDSAPTQLDLGNLYLNWLHRPSDAAAVYRQAIKLQPDHGGALSAWPWACPDIYPLIYPKRYQLAYSRHSCRRCGSSWIESRALRNCWSVAITAGLKQALSLQTLRRGRSPPLAEGSKVRSK